jgi:hypothetical protein
MILRATELQISFSAFLGEFAQTRPDSNGPDNANPYPNIRYVNVRKL